MPSLVSLWNEVWEMSTEILHESLSRSGLCFRLVMLHGKFALINQKHYPDLGNDTSSEYEISVLVSQMSFHSETSGSVAKSWLFSHASYLPAIILCLAGSGVVTRRPLILQLVHTPPKATTSSKRSSKGIKPKSVEDEDGDSCEKWVLHLLLIMTNCLYKTLAAKLLLQTQTKILSHHSASAPPQVVACQKDIISDKLET